MTGKKAKVVLFVRGLPPSVTRDELKHYFRRSAKTDRGLRSAGRISVGDCDILKLTGPDNQTVEYHGLVEVGPATLAMRLMKKLDGATFHGRSLSVRRYRERSPFHDRRQRLAGTEQDNRRTGDRRRPALKIDLAEPVEAGMRSLLARLLRPFSRTAASIAHLATSPRLPNRKD